MAVTKGKLDFGPWEQIFYGEFDGGRKKRCWSRLLASSYRCICSISPVSCSLK